jgi:hypothetical protein
MSTEHESLGEKNARLQARVDELEAQLDEKTLRETLASPDVIKTAREIPERTLHEFTQISRALLAAAIEQLRVSAEVIDKFAKGSTEIKTLPTDSITNLLVSIPRSVISGVVKAADHALEGPSRLIHKFYRTYTAPAPTSESTVKPITL